MAAKIVKETKKTIASTESNLKIKYTLAVPALGILEMATMVTYAGSPLIAANPKAFMTFLALAFIGVVFAAVTYFWNVTADTKGVTVRTVLSGERTILYGNIKRVEVSRPGSVFTSYAIIRQNGKVFLRVNLAMANGMKLLERLKKLGVKVVEK